MSTFQYTITKYDNAAKTLKVDFGAGGYATITLMDPLPTNIDELELIIRQYVLPQQYIDALSSPVDMSYVDQYVGHTRYCERRSIQTTIPAPAGSEQPPVNANENWNIDNPYAEDVAQTSVTDGVDADIAAAHKEFSDTVESILRQHGLIK